jgi:hypothetical protein
VLSFGKEGIRDFLPGKRKSPLILPTIKALPVSYLEYLWVNQDKSGVNSFEK